MKELRNINLSFILFLLLGCQSKENDIKFIKNKKLINKIDETIEFIETIHDKCKYVSIKLLTDKEGNEYMKIQSEPNINNIKIFYQEKYQGKLIVVYEATESLLDKYFDKKYKQLIYKKDTSQDIMDIYENIGYIFKVTEKSVIIEGTIGWKAPEEIEFYRNSRIIEILPPKLSK